MAKVKKRVLAFSRETNRAMRSHIVLRIKSLVEVTWSHEVNSYIWKWFKSHAQGMFAQREETKLIATPYEAIWEEMAYEDIENSSGWNGYILLILSIGMLYYQGGCNTNYRQVSSAQINRTQVLTWEKHIIITPAFVNLGACSWLGWIALETSFPKSPRSLKTEFGVKSYGVFREVTYAVF
jgi:hypothetical protein